MQHEEPVSVAADLQDRLLARLRDAARDSGGWLPFDRFMALVLYTPGLGYYANAGRKFGALPGSGSDFVTAPELTPLFGRALSRQVRQALVATATAEVWEFGAGSGALAAHLLGALGGACNAYHIVELSGVLRERQRERIARELGEAQAARVTWHDELPRDIRGVVVGNEVLDAMPVQLLHFDGQDWWERGVAVAQPAADGPALQWADRPTPLRPPVEGPFVPGTVTEIHPQAEAFIRTLAGRMTRGAAFFIDYGFPETEYYHPQRTGGTLMCHRGHQADPDPLSALGLKDITSHVNFTGIALAGQDSGLDVLGYTTQARFLLNCGLLDLLPPADPDAPAAAEAERLKSVAAVQKLVAEHEMGELFKVIGFSRGAELADAMGFAVGDRSHRL
ncbi:SAM-dependent methyltransferase [Aquabacterium sp. A7-Y]|uniref:class I SAM-dependent methyltransferase n=1 Tax=Aquabacterium sp. A7-Y TaxID=1349605 RepID=UPI00223E74EE|nr:SAM-dependent methyltransferase [Aquabacterium sp. A7-Y]MCW7541998.1 SAM-dependent methyltransferase [Aquabacterium sp. A7-Y]